MINPEKNILISLNAKRRKSSMSSWSKARIQIAVRMIGTLIQGNIDILLTVLIGMLI